MDNSFTYMISSDDRTNTTLPAAGFGIQYDVNFGGFSEQYEDYMCEVVSFALTGGVTAGSTYWMFCVENLSESVIFVKRHFQKRMCIINITIKRSSRCLYSIRLR